MITIEEDVSGWRTNENFIEWMLAINPNLDKEELLGFTEERWLGGYCEDFALYFAIRWNVPMLFLNHEHNIVQIRGKYFDGADVRGKLNLKDMKYVKNSQNLYGMEEEELQKLLIVDEDWKGYAPLANHVHLINRVR